MAEGRPELPAAVKRAVRQRCGFGCVVCGLPLYTYEHMYDWAKTHSHAEEELTLLCDRHQSERTKGLLPREAVLVANAAPVKIKNGVSEPYDGLHFSGSSGELILGNNRFLSQGMRLVPLLANGEEPFVFDFADGSLKFIAHVRDKDGTAVWVASSARTRRLCGCVELAARRIPTNGWRPLCRSKIRFGAVACADVVGSGGVLVFVDQASEDGLSSVAESCGSGGR